MTITTTTTIKIIIMMMIVFVRTVSDTAPLDDNKQKRLPECVILMYDFVAQ